MAVSVSWKDAQMSVLGALLLDPDYAAAEVFQLARREHFGDPECRHVFEAAKALWEEAGPLDPVTVCARAGDQYANLIAECMQKTPTSANAAAYCQIIRSKARITALQTEAMKMISEDVTEETVMTAYERMGNLLQGTDSGICITVADLIGDFIDRMHSGEKPDYLDWGIDKLNKCLYASPGSLIYLAGDASSGKTALALQLAYHMAAAGKSVGFISLETGKDALADRLMAENQVAGISLPDIKRHSLHDADFERAGMAALKQGSRNLKILNRYHTLTEIRAQILINRFDVVFIDYVQLIDEPGRERWDVVTRISMSLHRMAQQLGVTVIGLSQVTPQQKGGKQAPTKDDLRESRQLKQDADMILILSDSTGENDPPHTRVLTIAKNKDGRCGKIKLRFEPQHMTFNELLTMDGIRADGRMEKNRRRSLQDDADADALPI